MDHRVNIVQVRHH